MFYEGCVQDQEKNAWSGFRPSYVKKGHAHKNMENYVPVGVGLCMLLAEE